MIRFLRALPAGSSVSASTVVDSIRDHWGSGAADAAMVDAAEVSAMQAAVLAALQRYIVATMLVPAQKEKEKDAPHHEVMYKIKDEIV